MKKPLPLALLFVSAVTLVGCDKCSGTKDNATSTTPAAAPASDTAATTTTAPAGTTAATATPEAGAAAPDANATLQMTDIKVGTGPEAVDGKKVSVFYTGTLMNGTKFDSTKDRGTPFSFVLGSGMVIAGWDQGVKGMKEGGMRKLVIPPNLAYGNRAVGGVIPPNSTLIFEIELLKVE